MHDEPSPTRQRIVHWSDPKAAARAGLALAGIDYLKALARGELPPPPAIALLGITLDRVEPGFVVMGLPVGEHLYNPIGTVHGGMIATLLDSVMGCAVHSQAPLGGAYTTLEIKVNFLRALTVGVGAVRGEGRVVHFGRRQAVAEGKVVDAGGRLYATASTTCLVFEQPGRA
ncbi:PaaI family thioesterase [Microvirga pudoricolor]|uniref:PaaI family thioesterase n=1 Tax=Microvirga pudoricolor TaxID=2778729 RepID=UPI00194EDB94|nr:PaaI family thioesterase [Microvirga pudoricolor]MBM6594350.1 PaaI family thioesterase [Microvirga pudoricolor]